MLFGLYQIHTWAEMKRLSRNLFAFGFLALFALPATTEDHPTILGERDSYRGFEWIAASEALGADGSLKDRPGFYGEPRQESFEWHEDEDLGVQASCPDVLATYEPVEDRTPDTFDTTLLLSDVAVMATLGESNPGFDALGNPMALVALMDVVPLHVYSPTPEYVLLPLDRMETHGRLFCLAVAAGGGYWRETPPSAGDRVVLIGSWASDGVVRVWHERHPPHTAAFGQLANGQLTWLKRLEGNPSTLTEFQDQIDGAVAGGLFEAAMELRSLAYDDPQRVEFKQIWRSLNAGGCKVTAATPQPDDTFSYTRTCRVVRKWSCAGFPDTLVAWVSKGVQRWQEELHGTRASTRLIWWRWCSQVGRRVLWLASSSRRSRRFGTG